MWLIHHRVDDDDDPRTRRDHLSRGEQDIFEKDLRKMPDGTEKWFRAPTFLEASRFWKIPLRTISHWWKSRQQIFDGVVPQHEIPLVNPSERSGRPKPVCALTPGPIQPAQLAQSLGPTHEQVSDQATRPVYDAPSYPQAAQPQVPPLHPPYRANFAVEEVRKEVSHMFDHHQDIHLENLQRAIVLSQALVNDLAEAHKVLLNPHGYPQYCGGAPPVPPPP